MEREEAGVRGRSWGKGRSWGRKNPAELGGWAGLGGWTGYGDGERARFVVASDVLGLGWREEATCERGYGVCGKRRVQVWRKERGEGETRFLFKTYPSFLLGFPLRPMSPLSAFPSPHFVRRATRLARRCHRRPRCCARAGAVSASSGSSSIRVVRVAV
eukprot:6202586-Pleurochrysis_carterae.AAC.1